MFAACLFDWDGTIADTRQAILLSFRRALSKIGVEVEDEFVERLIGIGAARTFEEILKARNMKFDKTLIINLVNEKIQAEIELDSSVTLFSGAFEILEALEGKLKIALASMNNRAIIGHLLAKMDLNRFFDAVLTVEDVSNFKPAPEVFLKCSSFLGVSPENCLVVEDSIFGVQAAKAAGMGCLAVATGAYKENEIAKFNPDLIVSSLSEKGKVLSFIFQ